MSKLTKLVRQNLLISRCSVDVLALFGKNAICGLEDEDGRLTLIVSVPGEHAAELAVRVQHLGPAPGGVTYRYRPGTGDTS